MQRIRSFFGGRSKAEKRAEAEARQAQNRSQRDAEEEAQRLRAERAASGRLMRQGGRRMLTFQGVETGLASTLGG